MRAAITGGTGFVGGALIDRLLDKNWKVAALARDPKSVSRASAVEIIEGDLENAHALQRLAAGADVFIHLAGVTHARRDSDYYTVNVEGAKRAAKAAAAAGAKFLHISSMSARKPDTSPYARSKFDSESAIAAAADGHFWIALRLPAIYGPGDMATLPYFKLIRSGFALEPKTNPPARASILFVEDAAEAVIAAIGAPPGRVYEIGDDSETGHEWSEIGAVLGEVLAKKPRRIRLPRPVIALYHQAVRMVESAANRPPSVRSGQINEFFHPDWVARDQLLSDACGWRARTPLKEGFAKTAHWYQENGLL